MPSLSEQKLKKWIPMLNDLNEFTNLCNSESCIGDRAITMWNTPENNQSVISSTQLSSNEKQKMYKKVFYTYSQEILIQNILEPCAAEYESTELSDNSNTNSGTDNSRPINNEPSPFDRRLDRLETLVEKGNISTSSIKLTPFGFANRQLATTGYIMSATTAKQNKAIDKDGFAKLKADYDTMAKNDFYYGVPSLQNNYSVTRLYGSNGGKYLINQKGKRRWYEVDTANGDNLNIASTPTTTALISWGAGDPYGRTPYQFSDFVFSKYWNKIQNNRMITLRRYPAPILDNLKFPGMINTGDQDTGTYKDNELTFSPMATAVTYFGGDTGNNLTNILKFTTGLPWDDLQASVWEVNTESVPNAGSGMGEIFGGLGKFAELLNITSGKYDPKLALNKGQMPPDPYKDGPYENRIQGPINRIDSIKKRKPGLTFQWDGLSLVFEYVARPVGGISPKAVLLDIMANFLVIGSASAVFFGGAHRFMANPAVHPFMGGDSAIKKMYSGDQVGWAKDTITAFTNPNGGDGGSIQSSASNIMQSLRGFFSQLFSGEHGSIVGSFESLLGKGATGNLVNNFIANKTTGGAPYISGMKAILTGEPVGEWHITVGNPLNPIAMIGNLICDGMTVEFNDELGPDDFPTEIKITVTLKHAMARDKDSIESIFNRGMGRIYTLPNSLSSTALTGSADYQTVVDDATKAQGNVKTGVMPDARRGIFYQQSMSGRAVSTTQLQGTQPSNSGEISIWNRNAFSFGISENSDTSYVTTNDLLRSSYRISNWIAQKGHQS